MNYAKEFPKGILTQELLIGEINAIFANSAQVSLIDARNSSGTYYHGGRYGKGEVGEFIIIEGQVNLVLGRIIEVKENEVLKSIDSANGRIQLLGSISMETLQVTPGIESYPRLKDRVYSAPHKFISMLPELMDVKEQETVALEIGTVDVAQESAVKIKPEKLFGRHLAILGSTGGGKSWTTARIIEESLKFNAKLILLDATGEYRNLEAPSIAHVHLSTPVNIASNSVECNLPPTSFQESDFIALFEPSGKVQGPKLKEAIKSLRLAEINSEEYVYKINQSKRWYNFAIAQPGIQALLDNPETPFNVAKLPFQIQQECVWPNGGNANRPDYSKWGNEDGNFTHCLPLVTRINGIISSPAFDCVFQNQTKRPLFDEVNSFFETNGKNLLRIDLSGLSFEYKSREIISNVIGRYLLKMARNNKFSDSPLVLFLDEAHNFLGKNIGNEESIAKLDAFELIAKEGRKFGLNICLATQRPRDITEGVLSQMGAMIVHRLTNDRDREVVERACGEIDKAASAFLPNLKPGEAAIIGNDFPIPLTVQIARPCTPPESAGPDYQSSWL